ncbi:hypothetical protein CO2235_150206 [Cupriavidus oxalaticus]|uniref:Uncharacterized protein n=1 Tax=Cupriavidus oxalaticus TaxID=96344 RepID=A0A976BAN7_9BURK|nr:hypothetical protein CO2235_150206 [Cupriavidus oxalaticus]
MPRKQMFMVSLASGASLGGRICLQPDKHDRLPTIDADAVLGALHTTAGSFNVGELRTVVFQHCVSLALRSFFAGQVAFVPRLPRYQGRHGRVGGASNSMDMGFFGIKLSGQRGDFLRGKLVHDRSPEQGNSCSA